MIVVGKRKKMLDGQKKSLKAFCKSLRSFKKPVTLHLTQS